MMLHIDTKASDEINKYHKHSPEPARTESGAEPTRPSTVLEKKAEGEGRKRRGVTLPEAGVQTEPGRTCGSVVHPSFFLMLD